ncbi:MAG TPA: hypothetical protein VM347_11830 [Nonomuraea sp.]|nr:hypothetical protein [Nonomuraea sp.]
MHKELDEWHARSGGYVGRPSFESYAEKYADYFAMRRRDGIIELRMHTHGGPAQFGFAVHNAWGQAWQEIGNDPGNEVLILTGTGDHWLAPVLAGEDGDTDLGEATSPSPLTPRPSSIRTCRPGSRQATGSS